MLDDVSLAGARVSNADASRSRWSDASLRGARFEGSDLSSVEIAGCNVDGLTIDGVRVDELLKAARAQPAARRPQPDGAARSRRAARKR